jgi:MFS family permease
MKPLIIAVVLFFLSALLFFVVPHHRRQENSFNACTLSEIYGQFFHNIPEIISPRLPLFLLLACAGIVAAFYPVIFVLLAHWLLPTSGQNGRLIFLLSGLLAAAGAFANFIAIIVSHLSLGFGTSTSSRDETPFIWIIPLFQMLFAAASIAISSADSGTGRSVSAWPGPPPRPGATNDPAGTVCAIVIVVLGSANDERFSQEVPV